MAELSLKKGAKDDLSLAQLRDGQVLIAINGNNAEMYVDFMSESDAQVVRRKIDKVLTTQDVITALGYTPLQHSNLIYATD
ncbi:MAG: hypothetical protein J6T34_05615, partial [Bacilli bacterium]|nr:hypothetical protein [Bacilli bacterium]